MGNYNINLRSKILVYSIKQEELTSEIVKKFIRTVKSDLKTLGNKTSSFSFKNKVDLLFDIGDIENDQYSFFIKFMEIRNQFIHNSTCSTFLNLKSQNKDVTNFLVKHFKNDIEDEEQSLCKSFDELNALCEKTLFKLLEAYDEGISKEYHRFLDAKLENKFEVIISKTIKDLKESGNLKESDIVFMELCLQNNREDESFEIYKKLFNGDISDKDIFDRKK